MNLYSFESNLYCGRKYNMSTKTVIIVCGLPGTGKTTVAKILMQKYNALHLRTDMIRKELSASPTYHPKEVDQVYKELFRRAEVALTYNNVILDATFTKTQHRCAVRALVRRCGARIMVIRTTCPEKIVKRRLERRIGDVSEAKFEHYLKLKAEFQPLTEQHMVIDTSLSVKSQIEKLSSNLIQ